MATTEATPERRSMRCEAPDDFHDQVRFLGAADCVDSGELFRQEVSAYNLVLLLFTWGSGKAKEGVLAPKFLLKFPKDPPTTTTSDSELIKKLQQGWGLWVRDSAAGAGSAFPNLSGCDPPWPSLLRIPNNQMM